MLTVSSPAVGERPQQSVCRGTPADGSLEGACKLPAEGANFHAYSRLGSWLGRTWVHCTVASVVADAYERLASDQPELIFVYGETGLRTGGPFKPHKTHQNGLSVDFFVPVRDRDSRPVPLATHPFNKWGYSLEFDTQGIAGGYRLDFEAVVAHLLALDRAARAHGIAIARVLFDPEMQPLLHRSRLWPELDGRFAFSTRQSWVRHDEHYHVDFEVPCESSTP
jgi:penicillin-insensitive murein endopeptidase